MCVVALGLLASMTQVGCLVASGDPGNPGQDPAVESSTAKGASGSAQDMSAEAHPKGLANFLKPELPCPPAWELAQVPDAGAESHPSPTISRPMPSPLLGAWPVAFSDDGEAPDGAPESDFVMHIREVEERR
jgi:hypothetical protein